MFRSHPFPRNLPRMVRLFAPTLASLVLTGASFLPGHVKQLIHSRGPLHDVYHLAAFAGFAVLLHLCGAPRRRQVALAGWAVLLGCTIEFAEAAGSYTDIEIGDILCDTLGVLLGLLLAWKVEAWLHRVPELRDTQPLPTPELA